MTDQLLMQWGGGIMFMLALATLMRIGMTMQPDDADDPSVQKGIAFTMFMLVGGIWFLSIPAGGIVL